MDKRPAASEIEEAAARWVIRLDCEGRTYRNQAELDAWLAEDARRAGALLQAEAAWALLDRAELVRVPSPGLAPRRGSRARGLLLGGAAAALAASLAVVALHTGWTWLMPRETTPRQLYATGQGQVQQVTLSDGSSVLLNALSTVKVAYEPGQRSITLVRGEAWFDVARNPARPFVVSAGQANVRAVGTAFAVQNTRAVVDVRVTEGVVEVWANRTAAGTTRVEAGGAVEVTADAVGPVRRQGVDAIERQLQWRTGKLDLQGQTLGQAVDAFNRYGRRKLVIVDAHLADERLYGVFRLDDGEGFARAVEASLGIPVDYSDPIRILLGTAPSERPAGK